MISGFIELPAKSFGRNWTIQMLIQLGSHFGGGSLMFSSHNALNASLSVSLKVWPIFLRMLEVFSCFLNSVTILDMVALEKPISSAVLVIEAPAIRDDLQRFTLFQTQLGHAFYFEF